MLPLTAGSRHCCSYVLAFLTALLCAFEGPVTALADPTYVRTVGTQQLEQYPNHAGAVWSPYAWEPGQEDMLFGVEGWSFPHSYSHKPRLLVEQPSAKAANPSTGGDLAEASCQVEIHGSVLDEGAGSPGPPALLRVNCSTKGHQAPSGGNTSAGALPAQALVPVHLGEAWAQVVDKQLVGVRLLSVEEAAGVPAGHWSVTFLADSFTRLTLANSRVYGISMAIPQQQQQQQQQPPGELSGPLLRVMGSSEVVMRDSALADIAGLNGPVLLLAPRAGSTQPGESGLVVERLRCINVSRSTNMDYPYMPDNCGACVAVAPDVLVTGRFSIHDSMFESNRAVCGAVLSYNLTAHGTDLQVINTVATGNSVTRSGGVVMAFSLSNGTAMCFCNTTVSRNYAGISGGAVHVSSSTAGGTLRLSGSSMSHNTAAQNGGAIYMSALSGVISVVEGSIMANNTALNSGGAICVTGLTASGRIEVLGGSSMSNNTAALAGGALMVGGDLAGAVTVAEGSMLEGNQAGLGGAVSVYTHLLGTLAFTSGAHVSRNNASRGGVVLVNYDLRGALLLDNATAEANSAYDSGAFLIVIGVTTGARVTVTNGSVLSRQNAFYGAGFFFVDNVTATRIVFDASYVTDNEAIDTGGIVYMYRHMQGGSEVVLTNGARAERNVAGTYGAVLLITYFLPSAAVTVTNGTVMRDNAGRQISGGFLTVLQDLAGVVTITNNSAVVNNTGASGAAITANYACPGTIIIANHSSLDDNTVEFDGGAVYCGTDFTGLFRLGAGCSISRNSAGRDGGAVYSGTGWPGRFIVEAGATIANNTAGRNGGALSFTAATTGQMTFHGPGTVLSGNYAGSAGGLLYAQVVASTIEMRDVVAADNAASGFGGAIAVEQLASGGTLLLDGVQLSGNEGNAGGAVHVGSIVRGAALRVGNRTVLNGNSADFDGGAMKVVTLAGALTISGNSTISHNIAQLYGGGISIRSLEGSVGIDQCSLANNSALVQDGGAIQVLNAAPGSEINLTHSTFEPGNWAQRSGGALFMKAAAAAQQALSSNDTSSLQPARLYVSSCHFMDNKALTGAGGALALVAPPITRSGIPQELAAGTYMLAEIQDSFFTSNSAARGGALDVIGAAAALSASGCTFVGNTAGSSDSGSVGGSSTPSSGCGGAVSAEGVAGTISLESSSFDSNAASVSGGAVYISRSRLAVMSHTNMTGNAAGTAGGGVTFSSNLAVTMTKVHLNSNFAGVRGGGAVLEGGSITTVVLSTNQSSNLVAVLRNCSLSGNHAGFPSSSVGDSTTYAYTAQGFGPEVASVTRNATAVQPSAGIGGGLHVSGAVSVLLDRCISAGDAATVGPALAVEKRCSASATASGAMPIPTSLDTMLASSQVANKSAYTWSPSEVSAITSTSWAQTVSTLAGAAAAYRCWPVVTVDVQMAGASNANPRSLVSLPQQPSAFVLACSVGGAAHPLLQASAGSSSAPLSSVLPLPVAGQAADASLAAYVAQAVAADVSDTSRGGLPLSRLQNALSEVCTATVPITAPQQQQPTTVVSSLVAVNPSYITYASSSWDGWSIGSISAMSDSGSAGNGLALLSGPDSRPVVKLAPNGTVNITAELHTFQGTLMPDHVPINLSISITTTTTSSNSGSGLSSSPLPQLLGDLTAEARGGRVLFCNLTLRAVPGLYTLSITPGDAFAATYIRDQAISLVPAIARVVPCLLGQVPRGVGSTSCDGCPTNTFSLWQDPAWDNSGLAVPWQGARSKSRGGVACDSCPPNAYCPGGPVIVPLPGWWHSAPNSTSMHRCLNAEACDWEGRTEELAACQLAWYASLAASVVTDVGITESQWLAACRAYIASSPARRALSLNGKADLQGYRAAQMDFNQAYGQLQCAEGYTGPLCAACQPSYYIDSDTQCEPCQSVTVHTTLLGVAVLLAGVTLVCGTLYITLSDDYTQECGVDTADVWKVLVVHVQYFIIIARLNIPWPDAVNRFNALCAAITAAENYIAFSPSCMWREGTSAWQARAQLIGSLLMPVFVVLVCMALWTLRWWWRTLRARRQNSHGSSDAGALAAHLPSTRMGSDATLQAHRSLPAGASVDKCGCSSIAGPGHMHVPTSPSQGTRAESARAVAEQTEDLAEQADGNAPVAVTVAEAGVIQPDSATMAGSSPKDKPVPVNALPNAENGEIYVQTPLLPTTRPVATTNALPSSSAQQMPCPHQSSTAAEMPSTSQPHNPSSHPEPFRHACGPFAGPMPEAQQSQAAVGAEASSGGGGFEGAASLQGPPPPTLTAAGSAGLSAAGSLVGPQEPSTVAPSIANTHSTYPNLPSQATISNSLKAQPSASTAMEYVDSSLPLWRQLLLVLLVAAFILYPGWASAALSVFACYKIDSGKGIYGQNQLATWRHGYWIRDMTQECYMGLHASLYLPIGIVSVLLFCVGPPLTSFMLLWTHRHRLHEPDVAQQYGFLYTRYRPRWWFFESVLQLETLGLVLAEVLGRTLPLYQHAVVLLVVLLAISIINLNCRAMAHSLLVKMEFVSLQTLVLTIGLSLLFLEDEQVEGTTSRPSNAALNAVGVIIVVINVLLMATYAGLVCYYAWVNSRKFIKALPSKLKGISTRRFRSIRNSISRGSRGKSAGGVRGGGGGLGALGGPSATATAVITTTSPPPAAPAATAT